MPNNRLSPHDRFIKSMMSNDKVIREFFDVHLPQSIKDCVDLTTITPQRESFIDDKLKLQMADLLYAVNVRGKVGYLYLLVENQSSPDKLMPFRLLKYMTAIMDHHLKRTGDKVLPLVFPMVLYTGVKSYRYSMDIFDLFGELKDLAKATLLQPYQLIDLSQASDDELKRYQYFGAMALIAKHIHDPDILPFLKTMLYMLKDWDNYGETDALYVTLSYIVEAGEVFNDEEFTATLKSVSFKDEDKVMTIAEMFTQKGFSKGIEQGITQGIEQGMEKGKFEAAHKIALNLLKLGISADDVAQATALPLEEIHKLRLNLH